MCGMKHNMLAEGKRNGAWVMEGKWQPPSQSAATIKEWEVKYLIQ